MNALEALNAVSIWYRLNDCHRVQKSGKIKGMFI